MKTLNQPRNARGTRNLLLRMVFLSVCSVSSVVAAQVSFQQPGDFRGGRSVVGGIGDARFHQAYDKFSYSADAVFTTNWARPS